MRLKWAQVESCQSWQNMPSIALHVKLLTEDRIAISIAMGVRAAQYKGDCRRVHLCNMLHSAATVPLGGKIGSLLLLMLQFKARLHHGVGGK